jgi:hypothetical protein
MQEQQISSNSNELHFTRYFAHQQSVNLIDEVNAIKEQRETLKMEHQNKDNDNNMGDDTEHIPNQLPHQDSSVENHRMAFAHQCLKTNHRAIKKQEKQIHLISTFLGFFCGMFASAFLLHLATIEPLMICRVLMLLVASFAWIPVTWIIGEAGSEALKVTSFSWMTLNSNHRVLQKIIPLWADSTITSEQMQHFIYEHRLHCDFTNCTNLQNYTDNHDKDDTRDTTPQSHWYSHWQEQLMSHTSSVVASIKQWRFKKD